MDDAAHPGDDRIVNWIITIRIGELPDELLERFETKHQSRD